MLLLGLDAPAEELEAGFAATAATPIVKGFAVGRTIFMAAAEAWLAGRMPARRYADPSSPLAGMI